MVLPTGEVDHVVAANRDGRDSVADHLPGTGQYSASPPVSRCESTRSEVHTSGPASRPGLHLGNAGRPLRCFQGLGKPVHSELVVSRVTRGSLLLGRATRGSGGHPVPLQTPRVQRQSLQRGAVQTTKYHNRHPGRFGSCQGTVAWGNEFSTNTATPGSGYKPRPRSMTAATPRSDKPGARSCGQPTAPPRTDSADHHNRWQDRGPRVSTNPKRARYPHTPKQQAVP